MEYGAAASELLWLMGCRRTRAEGTSGMKHSKNTDRREFASTSGWMMSVSMRSPMSDLALESDHVLEARALGDGHRWGGHRSCRICRRRI